MPDLFYSLKSLVPAVQSLSVQEIRNENITVGWNAVIVDNLGSPISGGTSIDLETAKRIAVAECFEKGLIKKISKSEELSRKFKLGEFPSSSGFAAGFDEKSTRFRAICEGLERWVWSQWIDRNRTINAVSPELTATTSLARYLMKNFVKIHAYQKRFELEIESEDRLKLVCSIFLGESEEGIFAGSRVTTDQDECWEHAVIEAHRNLNNEKFREKFGGNTAGADIIKARASYFAKNKNIAFQQIAKCTNSEWPEPQPLLIERYLDESSSVIIWRCLFKDFLGWDKGNVERFVY